MSIKVSYSSKRWVILIECNITVTCLLCNPFGHIVLQTLNEIAIYFIKDHAYTLLLLSLLSKYIVFHTQLHLTVTQFDKPIFRTKGYNTVGMISSSPCLSVLELLLFTTESTLNREQ